MADRSWPPVLRFAESSFQIVGPTRSGGQSLEGNEQIVAAPAGRWKATVAIPLVDGKRRGRNREDATLAFRWVVSGGRANPILLPHRDGRGPAHRAGIVPSRVGVPHSDGTRHSDGAGYSQVFTGGVLTAAVQINQTQIQIRIARGLVILPGMRFSTPDGRMHEISNVVAFDGVDGWTVTIAPWLRAAYAAGTALEFDAPVCRMRLATDDSAALTLSLNKFGNPSLEFVEAF